MAKAEDRIVGLQESNTSLIARLADLVRESTTLEKVHTVLHSGLTSD